MAKVEQALSDTVHQRTCHVACSRGVTFCHHPIESSKPRERLASKVQEPRSLFTEWGIEQTCHAIEIATHTWTKLQAFVAIWQVVLPIDATPSARRAAEDVEWIVAAAISLSGHSAVTH